MRSILKRIFVVLVLASGSLWIAVLGYLGYLGYQGYLDYPSYFSEPFVFEPGRKHLEMDVFHECNGYWVEIEFFSKDGRGPIRKTFGHASGYQAEPVSMRAKTDIFLFDEHGQMVFSRTDFDGTEEDWHYSDITFIVGRVYLARGKYTAEIHIKQTDIDLSHFDARLNILQFHKYLSCGKEGEGLMYHILSWYWLFPGSI